MKEREEIKKDYTKKVGKLIKLGYNMDDLIKKAEEETIIKKYNEIKNVNNVIETAKQEKKVETAERLQKQNEQSSFKERETPKQEIKETTEKPHTRSEILRIKLRG